MVKQNKEKKKWRPSKLFFFIINWLVYIFVGMVFTGLGYDPIFVSAYSLVGFFYILILALVLLMIETIQEVKKNRRNKE